MRKPRLSLAAEVIVGLALGIATGHFLAFLAFFEPEGRGFTRSASQSSPLPACHCFRGVSEFVIRVAVGWRRIEAPGDALHAEFREGTVAFFLAHRVRV
jgi:hypothetical protein